MNNPELYNKFNQLQYRDAGRVIKLYRSYIAQTIKEVNLIDVGTGCGEVLANVVVKELGLNFKSVIGVDISEDMIKFARKIYANTSIQFEAANIESDFLENTSNPLIKPGSFDIVTSFYCLHWIRDLK
jgi:juvenile hormone acid methyltransferase